MIKKIKKSKIFPANPLVCIFKVCTGGSLGYTDWESGHSYDLGLNHDDFGPPTVHPTSDTSCWVSLD